MIQAGSEKQTNRGGFRSRVLFWMLPADSVRMSRSFLDGNINESRDLQLSMKALIDAMFADVNPIPVKAALWMMGRCKLQYRLPLCEPNQAVMGRIRREMEAYGVL